jgi:hypothetical protein
MFGIINTKVYMLFTILTTLLLYAIDFFDKHEIVKTYLLSQGSLAQSAGFHWAGANLIVRPLVYAIDNPIGAVVGGILWPVLFVWILLLFVLMTFAVIAPGVKTGLCVADAGC